MTKVISGGQIGADIAGLRAAKACGLETGGWMPMGFRSKAAPFGRLIEADVIKYGMQETTSFLYPPRTEYNIRDSDGTIRFAYNWNSAGEKLTARLVASAGKPWYDITLSSPSYDNGNCCVLVRERNFIQDVAEWLIENDIKTLNVAGNADNQIEACVEDFLVDLFTLAKGTE